MRKNWRGGAEATRKGELTHIFNTINVSEKDSFCDLGCGYGHLCIHARKWCNKSAGFETKKSRCKIARKRVKKSGIDQIEIFNKSYEHKKSFKILRNYNVIFCVNGLTKEYLKKLEKTLRRKSSIVLYYLPPVPLKPNKRIGWYFLFKRPFLQANSEKDWISSVTGKKAHTRKELAVMIRNNFRKDYDKRIQEFEEELDGVFKQ